MNRKHALVLSLVLLVVALGGYLVMGLRASAELETKIDQLLTDVATELDKSSPDPSELSSLVVRIQQVEGHGTDRRFLLAMARIDRARGRYREAWNRLLPVATAPDASGAELREGAALTLRLHAMVGDRPLGFQALGLAQSAYRLSQDPMDLLVAWQAAQRLQAAEDRSQLNARMAQDHEGALAARLLLALGDLENRSVEDLDRLAAEFLEEPVELALARAVLRLRDGAHVEALAILDARCAESPALVDLRHFAAVACYSVAREAGVPPERQRALTVKGAAHLEWLLKNALVEDPRRDQWKSLLGR